MSVEFSKPLTCNVLLVDDHAPNLLALCAVLEPIGQNLFTARSGEEALRLALNHDFAVILLDMRMPGMDGLETAAAIKQRARSRHTPIIFLTAEHGEAPRTKSYASGAVDYVTKPYDPDVLRSKVSVFVELYARGERIKKQEERLREIAQERLRVVVTHAPIVLFALDTAGLFTLCEGSELSTIGLLPGAVVGKSVFSVFALDPEIVEGARRALAGEHHTSIGRVSKHEQFFETQWVPQRSAGGHVTGVVGIAMNVSDRVRAEQDRASALARERKAQSERQSWLETVLDRMPIPLFLIELESARVVFSNSAAKVAKLERPRTEDVARVASGEQLEGVEVPWAAPHGERQLVAYSAPLPQTEGRARAAVLTYVDVTKLKDTEAELQSAVRVRDDFLSIASHELNTPLTPLKMQLGALMRRDWSPKDGPRRLQVIDRQVDRMTRLVAQLLDVSRISAGRLQLEPERIEVLGLVLAAASNFGPDLQRTGSKLVLDLGGPIHGYSDPVRVEQVIANLLSNAIKYGRGGPIEVRVRPRGEEVVITVTDEGIGIAPEQQAMIFERFERAVSVRHYGGFGIGLWIVRQVVEACGGTIAVSSALGVGSRFEVVLPLGKPTLLAESDTP